MRIFDLHNDIITSSLNIDGVLDYFAAARQAEVELICAVWTSELCLAEVSQRADFLRASNAKISFEDCGLVAKKPWLFLPYNPLYCTLTWNYDNDLAGGAQGDNGLTELGRDFISVLNQNKIAVDLSHLNRRSFFDVIEKSDRVLASHSCPSEFHAHPRNLSPTQIKLIIERGGIIGLTFVPQFIAQKASIFDVAEMIDRSVQRYGMENFAVGTDFFGVSKPIQNLENYGDFCHLKFLLQTLGYREGQINRLFYDTAAAFFADDSQKPL